MPFSGMRSPPKRRASHHYEEDFSQNPSVSHEGEALQLNLPKSRSSHKLFSLRQGDDQRHTNRSHCSNCGHTGATHPISPLVTSQQTAMEEASSSNKQALLPARMTRNDSTYSMGDRSDELMLSRRPSVLLQDILTTRRPSIVLAAIRGSFSAQRNPRNLGSLSENPYSGSGASMNNFNDRNGYENEKGSSKDLALQSKIKNRRIGDDALSTALSALYCKMLVVIGVALPITEIISERIPATVYQGFYVYMYGGSILFVAYVYASTLKSKALFNIIKDYHEKNNHVHLKRKATRFGSFYLRVGAIAFAIGTMVYSGLEFGQYFELNGQPGCQDVFVAVTPICRMILCIIQVQFIFLNTTDLDMPSHKVIARFGLMHMVATNLCEWLYVLVEETKHEIFHFKHTSLPKTTPPSTLMVGSEMAFDLNGTAIGALAEVNHTLVLHHDRCSRTNIMGALVQEVSPFLFPCTIEYSLICAVILYEMWKKVKSIPDIVKTRKDSIKPVAKNAHHFTVDCSRAHRGLFFGILVIVMTIISMIMYFVLYQQPGLEAAATKEVTIWEMVLYGLTSLAVVAAMVITRDLKYVSKSEHGHSLSLDCTLLLLAQTGVYIYGMFSIIGSYYATTEDVPKLEGIIAEVFALVQTSIQSLFILNACQRRCKGAQQQRKKPGREIVTFLIVANVSMWFINTLIKGRAVFRNSHLQFFGAWAWTIITHTSMPLAIFYRFHSTICLFEIWKSVYKAKFH